MPSPFGGRAIDGSLARRGNHSFMKKQIVITDLTRMQEGRVCIAGYDQHGQCIRPVLPPPGIHENTLYFANQAIIFPSAKVEFEFTQPTPQPPHTEDVRYDPAFIKFIERLPEVRWHRVLEATLSNSIGAIFEQPILTEPGHYVMDGRGPRSLGTIRPRRILQVFFEPSPESKWQYRLRFVDGESITYRLTITDLTWRYFCDHQRKNGNNPTQIVSTLTRSLQSSDIYLRIGLARGWDKFPDRCYIQITGVHTFPDYLNGRTFADFAP
jgi:hypothetical protein